MSDSVRTRSLGKRFTTAVIAVVTVLLVGFAAVVIGINVRKIDAELRDALDDAVRLAQVSLPMPVWNLDTELVKNFADALMLREAIAFVEIVSEGQTVVARARTEFARKWMSFADFERSRDHVTKAADIVHQGKKIGTVRLVVSRQGVRDAILWNVGGILALTLISIAAISVTSIVITRRYITRPLAALQESAGLIAGNICRNSRNTAFAMAIASSFATTVSAIAASRSATCRPTPSSCGWRTTTPSTTACAPGARTCSPRSATPSPGP